MNLILSNPYRILGLLFDCNASQKSRQTKRLRMFIEAEEEPESDFSFKILGPLSRNLEQIEIAESRLNFDSDKLEAALFWFYNGNKISDNPAFESLSSGDLISAMNYWQIQIDKGLSSKTSSAFFNLATLKLNNSFAGSKIIESALSDAIVLKLQYLESDFFNTIIALSTDKTYKISKKEVQLKFLNNILFEINNKSVENLNIFIKVVFELNFEAKEDFKNYVIDQPIKFINSQIENSKNRRYENKWKALTIGRNLHSETKYHLSIVKTVLGQSNTKYNSISNKLAEEILQCGIDYFKHYRDSAADPSSDVLALFQLARATSSGGYVKDRVNENIDNLKGWIAGKEAREKEKEILNELEAVKKILSEFELKADTISNARGLIEKAKPHLVKIKWVMGNNDELYLNVSTRVASEAQGMCVSEINNLQENLNLVFDNSDRYVKLNNLKIKVEQAWDVVSKIGLMGLNDEFKEHYKKNRSSLLSLKSQLSNIAPYSSIYNSTGQSSASSRSSSSNNSSSDTSFSELFPFILGAVGLIIGIAGGLGWGSIVFGIIGIGIGAKLTGH